MKIVILAAGEGVRMHPLTLTTPKPLLVYKDKTILDHLFEAFPQSINEAIIVVKYLGEKIRAHCGFEFHGKKISYVEGEKNGNALGFLKTKQFFTDNERFAVAYADEIISNKEIKDCLSYQYSWLCYHVSNPKEVGIAVTDKKNRIIDIIEKPSNPPSNFAVDGFMVLNADVFNYKPKLHSNGEYYFSNLMMQFSEKHEVIAVKAEKSHCQLTTPEDINRLNSEK